MKPTFFLSRTDPHQAWVVDPKYQAKSLEKARKLAKKYANENNTAVNIHWNLKPEIVETVAPDMTEEQKKKMVADLDAFDNRSWK